MMRTVFLSKKIRSKKILIILTVCLVFFLRFLASLVSSGRKLVDYTGAWQSDREFILYVRSALLWPPGNDDFNLEDPNKKDYSGFGQSKILAEIFHNKTGGVFIEAYAGDGEEESVSLYLERELGWAGLLVEEEHDSYTQLMKKNRRSYVIHSGLALSQTALLMYDRERDLADLDFSDVIWQIPLYSLYLAMGAPEFDALILNLYANEEEILETVPWENVSINVIVIDYHNEPELEDKLTKCMSRHDYTLIRREEGVAYYGSKEFLKNR